MNCPACTSGSWPRPRSVAIVVAGRHDSFNYVDGFLRLAATSALLLLPARAISRMAVLMARRRRWVEHSAIIVGGGPVAIELARLLRRYPQYGLRFAGYVDVPSTAHDQAGEHAAGRSPRGSRAAGRSTPSATW